MTKGDLVRELARARGVSLRQARGIVDALLGSIARALSDGETVTLRSFGRFEVHRRAARKVRTPGTDFEVRVPARLAPVFHGAPALGRRLQAARGRARSGR